MTRKEETGKRCLDFSKWVRVSLTDSYDGFRVSDVDFILANVVTKKIILLEEKTYSADCKKWQKNLFRNIDKWISCGIENDTNGWEYLGFHVVTFEKTAPYNGLIWFDDERITKEQLIEKLSF